MEAVDWYLSEFGPYAPLGLVLRHWHYDNWVRIHSLPQSKRYAETDDEYRTILSRHNKVTDDLFTQGERCVVIRSKYCTNWPEEREINPTTDNYFKLTDTVRPAQQYPGEYSEEEDDRYLLQGAYIAWRPKNFDEIVQDIADDITRGYTFISVTTCNVYVPYDGGADLIVQSKQTQEFKTKHSKWLSVREDGL